jgi:hypothetical protein
MKSIIFEYFNSNHNPNNPLLDLSVESEGSKIRPFFGCKTGGVFTDSKTTLLFDDFMDDDNADLRLLEDKVFWRLPEDILFRD